MEGREGGRAVNYATPAEKMRMEGGGRQRGCHFRSLSHTNNVRTRGRERRKGIRERERIKSTNGPVRAEKGNGKAAILVVSQVWVKRSSNHFLNAIIR